MNNINSIYEYMFALRVTLETESSSETDIIKEFKEYLSDLDYSIQETNDIIYNFYINNNINNITKTFINSIELIEPSIQVIFIEYLIIPSLNNVISNSITTLDDSEIDKLNKIVLHKNLDNICNICLEDMVKDDTIIKLECNHCFHNNCISTYLKKYNCICPICKYEISKKKI